MHRVKCNPSVGHWIKALVVVLTVLAPLAPTNAAAPPAPHAVIFMYHRFGEAKYPTTNVTLEQFRAQLDYLDEAGYQVWPLAKIVDHLKNARPIPDQTVAITVDDAYRSVYDQAFPLLQARGWPFTVFVSTEVVNEGLPAYMDWAQMRELHAKGVTFANHSGGHDHLIERHPGEDDAAWRRRVRDDIVQAEHKIKEELGDAAPFFAYPYGEYNQALAELIAELGYVGFGQQSGAVGAGSDLRILSRYPIAEAYADLPTFGVKAASLPLPVVDVQPWDPVLGNDQPPAMTMTLAPGEAQLDQLQCYASGQGRMEVTPAPGERRYTVRAEKRFQGRRNRYNCTAPGPQGRYFWFSHLWINPAQDEE